MNTISTFSTDCMERKDLRFMRCSSGQQVLPKSALMNIYTEFVKRLLFLYEAFAHELGRCQVCMLFYGST
jgi:hypothetical protein